MTATEAKPYIKFTYFHDPITPRTVTVARMLEGDDMYIAWCVNKMNKQPVAFANNKYVPEWYGDVFVKSVARDISRGRVLAREHKVQIDPTKRKIEQVVEFMTSVPSQFIQDIVTRSVEERRKNTASQPST